MADADPPKTPIVAPPPTSLPSGISRGRLVLLFAVMLVTAAGNTAMQSVMPSIGTSGLAFYTGDRFPEWRGNAFAGGPAGVRLAIEADLRR